jgi:hypothetical protein
MTPVLLVLVGFLSSEFLERMSRIADATDDALLQEEPLTFVLGFAAPHGTAPFYCWSLNSAGQGELTIRTGRKATRQKLEVSADQIASLKKTLVEGRLLELKEDYGPRVMHGAWYTLTVVVGQHRVKVVRFHDMDLVVSRFDKARWAESASAFRIWSKVVELVDPKYEVIPERKQLAAELDRLKK